MNEQNPTYEHLDSYQEYNIPFYECMWVKNATSPIDHWKYLYSEEILEVAVQYTNKYTNEKTNGQGYIHYQNTIE